MKLLYLGLDLSTCRIQPIGLFQDDETGVYVNSEEMIDIKA